MKSTVSVTQPKLEHKFEKYDAAALFLNMQPKRELAGGENLRLAVKKLQFEIDGLKDDMRDLEAEKLDLSKENNWLKSELGAQVQHPHVVHLKLKSSTSYCNGLNMLN